LQTKPEALLAPEEAVRTTERGWLVFVPEKRTAKDGQTEWIARPRRVETGYRGEGKVEIRDGVYPGEWIVQKGGDALDEDGLTPIRIPEEQLRLIDK
jgi:multidrug efflux system membrane fusion protein